MPIDNKYRSILWLKEDDIVDLFPSPQDVTNEVSTVRTELSTQLNSFQQSINQQITDLRNQTTTQINNVTQTLVDSLGQTRVTGIGSTIRSTIESNYIGVVVNVVGYMNLWENGSASYRVYVNNSSIGTINVNWRSQRTGGSGHGYSTSVGNCGYLSANRNIPQGASIRVDRVSNNGVVIDKEFVTIML